MTLATPFDPAARGYHAVYREAGENRCPGCDRQQWLVGRVTAECAFCSTALPLEASLPSSRDTITERGNSAGSPWPAPTYETPRLVRGKVANG